jgi:hypothetical protein
MLNGMDFKLSGQPEFVAIAEGLAACKAELFCVPALHNLDSDDILLTWNK